MRRAKHALQVSGVLLLFAAGIFTLMFRSGSPSVHASCIETTGTSGGGTVIKSIQQGTVIILTNATTATATITAVNTSKAYVIYEGSNGTISSGFTAEAVNGYLTLTNATTVTATKTNNSDHNLTIGFTVVEFN